MGLSLLPSDLNSTNLLLSGIVDLLDESLGTGESDTSDQVNSFYPFYIMYVDLQSLEYTVY